MDRFEAVADATRRHIIEMLSAGERPFGDIAGQFSISRPAVSQHLKVLRDAGLVAVRRDAQRRIYRLHQDGLAEIEGWLQRVQGFWAARLSKLEEALNEPSNDGGKSP